MSGAETKEEIVERDVGVNTFVKQTVPYYQSVFDKIQRRKLPLWDFNLWALLVPWVWAAARGAWFLFWVSLAFDLLAAVCLIQNLKYGPLLQAALADPDANRTLIPRYTGWIQVYTWVGIVVFIIGRLWAGTAANRRYYKQYSRWRIKESTTSGVSMKRLAIGILVVLIIVPLTLYRASQQRLDDRACFNQIKAAEQTEAFLSAYGVTDIDVLLANYDDRLSALMAEQTALNTATNLTNAQKSRRAKIKKRNSCRWS